MSAFNGSGTFVISGVGLPYVTGTTISSTVANQLNTDLGIGLSTCITKDGQTLPTNNIPMGGFKITGLGAATAPGDALRYGTGTNDSTLKVPTRQVLLAGVGLTYNTPPNCRQLRIRMIGAGGAGGNNSNVAQNGTAGGATIFNGIAANPGQGGLATGNPGAGGTGGAGVASLRLPGSAGAVGLGVTLTVSNNGPPGPAGAFGGGPASGAPAPVNTGSGGGGGSGSGFAGNCGGPGGAGEYAEIIINAPAATYIYTVGTKGVVQGGVSGAFGIGGDGASGIIIVDELY